MTAIQLATNDFGFGNEDIHRLASIKCWVLRKEATQSASYSRLRRQFMNEESKGPEQ
jgi:hypothetical protein